MCILTVVSQKLRQRAIGRRPPEIEKYTFYNAWKRMRNWQPNILHQKNFYHKNTQLPCNTIYMYCFSGDKLANQIKRY